MDEQDGNDLSHNPNSGYSLIHTVIGHLSKRSNGVLETPKFDDNLSPNPMPIRFRQMSLQTSELLPMHITRSWCWNLHFVEQNVRWNFFLVEGRNDKSLGINLHNNLFLGYGRITD